MAPALRLALALALLAGAARAQEADDGTCRNGGFPRENASFGFAKVQGAGRAYFLEDANGCPGEAAACRQRSYVTPGDTVLTGRSKGAYVCAFFANRGGGSAGWMRRDRLAPQSAPIPTLTGWAGTWHDGDDEIVLKARGGMLEGSGDAYWPSANPPLSLRPGGPNIGEFEGKARPAGARVVFSGKDPDDCSVVLTRVGPWLVATDNNNCGGQNVSFTGVYSRR